MGNSVPVWFGFTATRPRRRELGAREGSRFTSSKRDDERPLGSWLASGSTRIAARCSHAPTAARRRTTAISRPRSIDQSRCWPPPASSASPIKAVGEANQPAVLAGLGRSNRLAFEGLADEDRPPPHSSRRAREFGQPDVGSANPRIVRDDPADDYRAHRAGETKRRSIDQAELDVGEANQPAVLAGLGRSNRLAFEGLADEDRPPPHSSRRAREFGQPDVGSANPRIVRDDPADDGRIDNLLVRDPPVSQLRSVQSMR